jgi:uncharacterized repeat protein (TIGR01451 family)
MRAPEYFQSTKRQRRSAAAICLLLLIVGLTFAATGSQAANPICSVAGNFEIDGDMQAHTCAPFGDDWNSNIGVQQTTQGGTYNTADKDTSDPSNWTSTGATPNKTDFSQEYAASRVVNGDFFTYVAWERTAAVGTQGYVIEIDNSPARTAPDGTPRPDRSSGGFVFFISSQGGSAPQFVQSCHFTSQATYESNCSNSNAGFASATNLAQITDPLNNTIQPIGSFYEVALDVTALTGVAPSCPAPAAATVYLRSVTGQITNGNLKGYMGPLSVAPNSTCVPPPITTTATTSGNPDHPSGPMNPTGSTQWDTVTVGTQQAPGVGSVTFFLCSPTQLTNAGDCATGGTQVGTAKTLNQSGQATSDNVTGLTNPNDNANGKYCWRAEFTPGANDHHYFAGSDSNGDSSGVVGAECFTIVHKSPTIATQIAVTGQNAPGLGFTTLGDTATLSGFAAPVTGETIDFNLYGPFAGAVPANCTAGAAVFTTSGTLNAAGSATTNATFTPTQAGTYIWIASYAANQDLFNDGVTGTCQDANESTTIVASQITLSKSANPAGPVSAGDPIGFDITITNPGNVPATDVQISDPLPSGANGVVGGDLDWSLDPAYAGCSINGAPGNQTLDCTFNQVDPGSLPAIHITSQTTLADCGTVKNKATATTGNGTGGDSNTATVDVQCPNMTLTKTADNATVNAGDQIGFTITATNGNAPGTGTATGVVINDPLPAGSGVDWSIDPAVAPANCSINGAVGNQTLNCTAVDLAPGQSEAVHIISGTDKSSCQAYPNVATLTATANHPQLQATDTTTVLCSAVTILKTADHTAPVNAGSSIGFTVEVKNTGLGAANGVVLGDPLPAGSGTGVLWAVDPAVGNPAKFVLAGAQGKQTLSLASGTLPAGADYKVHVTAATSETECSGVYDNTATLTITNGNGPAPAHAKEACAYHVDLSITKAGSPVEQDLGQGNITWTIVVTNNGPDTDTGVKIADPIPSGNTFVSAVSTKGSCTGNVAILNCTIGDMAAGENVTITLVTTPTTAGKQTNTVTVVGDRPETNLANNKATATVQVDTITPPTITYCVAVSKVTPRELFVGRKTTLTIHLTKHGKAAAGVRVRIKGPKLNLTTKRSNAKGVVKQTLTMKKAGIDTFIPLASKHCNTRRIGVTGVFTPPVTG